MTESSSVPPRSAPRMTQKLGAAFARSRARAWFTWPRIRTSIAAVLFAFIVVRVIVGLVLNAALTKATEGTLGLRCKVGHSALNLFDGQAVLSDVALIGSSGKPIAVIGRAELGLAWTSLPNLIVDRVALEDVEVYLKRDARGEIPALAGLGGGAPAAKGAEAPRPDRNAPKEAKPAGPLPVVLLKRMRINHIRVHWEDETVQPTFKGELLLDARGDEIATFPRPQPPSFSLRLASPGILDSFRFDVAGRALEDGATSFDVLMGAEAHPSAVAPYLGKDVEIHSKTLTFALEGRANLRPTLLDGGRHSTGELTIERAELYSDEDDIELGRMVVIFSRVSRERVDLSSVSIDHPRFVFGRLADGTLRVLGFGLRGKGKKAAEEAPPEETESGPLPLIKIQEFALHDGKVHFKDEGAKTPVTLDVAYQARIEDVLVDPANPGRRARLEASCSVPGVIEKATLAGSFVPIGAKRDLELEVAADGIGLAAIAPYLKQAGFEPDVRKGTAQASIHAQAVETKDGGLGFSAEVTKAKYADQEDILAMRALRVEGGLLDPAGSLVIERIAVEDPVVNVRRHRSGALSVAGIRTTRPDPNDAPVAKDADEEESAPAAATSSKQSRIRINEVALSGCKVGWRDDALNQPVQLALDAGTFQLTGLALGEPGAPPATLRAGAKLRPAIGEVTIEAALLPDPGAPAISGTLTAHDVSPKPLAAYLKSFSIEPTLERGRIEAGLYAKARFKGPALAESRLVLAPLSLKMGVEELGSIASIELKNTSIEPATHTTNLGDLTITGVRARAFRDSQGAIRMLGLKLNPKGPGDEAPVATAATAAAPAPAARQRSGGILNMGELALRDVAFSWHDELTQPASDVRLERLDVTLGPRRLDVEPKPGDAPTPLKIHAQLYRLATLDVDAGISFISRAPSVTADLRLSDVTLAAVANYLKPAGYVPALRNGTLRARLETHLSFDQGITGAVLDLTKLAFADGGKELFGVDALHVPLELDPERRTFHTGEIFLGAPRLFAEKTKDGDVLALGLLVKKASPVAEKPEKAPAPEKPARQQPAQKPYTTTIDGVKVDALALDWRDAEAGDAHFEIKRGTIDVGPIRPGRKTQTPWKVRGDLGDLGELTMNGVATLTTKTLVEADIRIDRMRGREISPYLGEGTTLDLQDGTFSFKVAYAGEPAAAGGQKLSVGVTNLALEEKGALLLGCDALRAELARSDPAKSTYVVDSLELANLRGDVVKLPNGRSRSFGFDKRPVASSAAPAKAAAPSVASGLEPPPLPTVEVRKIALAASEITVRDRSTNVEPPPYLIRNVLLRNQMPFVLQSDDPTTAILDLALTAESGGTFELASATFRAIPFGAEPLARLELDLKGLSGDAIMKRSPGLTEKYDLASMRSGVAHLGLDFTIKNHERLDQLGSSQAPLAFELVLDGFDVRSTPGGPVLLGIDEVRMDVSSYDLATGAMTVKKLEVANPVGAFAKEPGGFRALDILTKNAPPAPEGAMDAPPEAPKPADSAKPALQRFERIVVGDGDLGYIDSTVRPLLDFHMSSFEIDILGYSNQWKTQKNPMNITIRSRGGSYDDFKIKGQLAFAPRLEGDFEARILGLPLERLSGFTERDFKLALTGGRVDIETRGSFKKGKLKTTARVTLMSADVDELEGCTLKIKTALSLLADADDQVQVEVPLELELDENLKVVEGSTKLSELGRIVGDALLSALKGLVGGAIDAITGSKKEVKKTDQASRRKPPVPFGPVETRLPDEAKAELDELAARLVAEPLFYVSLRGEIGRDDEKRAKVLASPAVGDRRDLIARMEAERARLERRRADAISEIRGALQAGTDDLGAGRSHLTEIGARLQKLDRSLEGLYEQEREGAERSADRRAREIEGELCESRVEAVRAYLVSKGAPVDRVKGRPPKLKPVEQEKGVVSIESWTARREAIKRDATKQETQLKEASPAK